jgi:2'-5' RNA ligase
VSGTGAFPPRGLPRILWAGLSPSPPLLSLARQVEERVAAAGLPREPRPFSPHITLARSTSADPAEVRHYLEQHRSFTLPPFPVDRFTLYASRLTPGGAIHTPLSVHFLTAAEES